LVLRGSLWIDRCNCWSDGNFAVSSFRKQIARCLEGAKLCVFEAEAARTAFEEEAWLDMADLWMELAQAFENVDQPTWH